MIRIDAMWVAVKPIDMRAGADRLLAIVVQDFGAAQAHHGYLFVCGWPWHLEMTLQARDHRAHVEDGRYGLVEGGGICLSPAQRHHADRIRHRASSGGLSPAPCVDLVEPGEISLRAATCGATIPRCDCSTALAAA